MDIWVIRLLHNDRFMGKRYGREAAMERVAQLQRQGHAVYFECTGWADVYAA